MKTIYYDEERNVVTKDKAVYFENIENDVRTYGDLRSDADRGGADRREKERILSSTV